MACPITLLPPELLEQIFVHLDVSKDILSLTLVCRTFKGVVENCERLTKNLELCIKYPTTKSVDAFLSVMNQTQRRYRKLSIIRSRRRSEEGNIYDMVKMLRSISANIKVLQINWHSHRSIELPLVEHSARTRREAILFLNNRAHQMIPNQNQNNNNGNANNGNNFVQLNLEQVPRDDIRDELNREFIKIIQQFRILDKLALYHVHLEKKVQPENGESLNFASLKELKMKCCDAYCFDTLASSTQLKKFEISEPYWTAQNPGINNFESFLVNQTELKYLKIKSIQYPRLFNQSDSTSSIRFKLNHLVLDHVFFKDKTIAENFFKTQTELKTIDFQVQNEKLRNLDEVLWYNTIIKTGKLKFCDKFFLQHLTFF